MGQFNLHIVKVMLLCDNLVLFFNFGFDIW